MSEPTLNFVNCPDATGGHRMAYWQWGRPQAGHVIVCAHGLSRQGRDFDVLAQELIAKGGDDVRVVCPDVVGRGQSDWLKDPMGYQIPHYAADMLALLAQLKPTKLDWVGTSMGGLIGIVLAGTPGWLAATAAATGSTGQTNAPAGNNAAPTVPGVGVNKLVLNDVGPVLEWEALVRIGQYLGNAPRFASLEQAAAAMWAVSTSFGPHTPGQWLALSRPMVKPVADAQGGVVLHYDPAIAVPFRAITQESAAQAQVAVWALYDNIKAPTLLLRGAQSDVLSPETALAMTQRGPQARLVEFEGVGHAPTLIADDQVDAVTRFLLG